MKVNQFMKISGQVACDIHLNVVVPFLDTLSGEELVKTSKSLMALQIKQTVENLTNGKKFMMMKEKK